MNDEIKYFFPYGAGYYIVYKINKNKNMISILDSYLHSDDKDKELFIKHILDNYPNMRKRKYISLFREWKFHNIMYNKGINANNHRSSHLKNNEKWYNKLKYFLVCLLFREE